MARFSDGLMFGTGDYFDPSNPALAGSPSLYAEPTVSAPAPAPATRSGGGGFGGLGGVVNTPQFGNILSALGHSLATGSRQNPLGGFSQALDTFNQRTLKQEELLMDRTALRSALQSAGFSAEEAEEYARNPAAAKLALDARDKRLERESNASFFSTYGAPSSSPFDGAALPDASSDTDFTGSTSASDDISLRPQTPSRPAYANALSTLTNPNPLREQSDPALSQAREFAEPAPGGLAPRTQTPASVLPNPNETRLNQLSGRRDEMVRGYGAATNDSQRAFLKASIDSLDKQIGVIHDEMKPTTDMREYLFAREQGYTGPFTQFQQEMRKASATTVNNNLGSEGGDFYKELDKRNAENFASIATAGSNARGRLAQIDQLDALLAQSPSGAEAGVKLWLGDYGVNTEGLDSLQATRALIEKMVPEQRQPGSGPMSDADIVMYRRSLASVLNQPGGNALIMGTARAIADYEVQMGAIADQVADRSMTPAQGREAMRNLQNPLAGWTEKVRALGGGEQGSGSTPASRPRATNPQTGATVEWDGSNWVPVQ